MNKQDVNRTQPKGCSTSDLDAVIERIESDKAWLLYEDFKYEGKKEVYEAEKKYYETILTALKFMRLMMEPSEEMLKYCIEAALVTVVEQAWEEIIIEERLANKRDGISHEELMKRLEDV